MVVRRPKRQVLDKKYDMLEYRDQYEIPYIKGEDIRADTLYLFDSYWGLNPVQIAKGRGLQTKTVNQALDWCRSNINLVERILNEGRKNAGLKPLKTQERKALGFQNI